MHRIKAFASMYSSYQEYLVEVVKAIDPQGYHAITYEELCLGFKKMNLDLNYQSIYTIMRKYDNGHWKFDVKAFFEDLKKI